jgi:hypothetical protein
MAESKKHDPMRDMILVVCPDRECRGGAGQFVDVSAFVYDDDAISAAREHYERTGHQVMVPFRIYERKGK